MIQSGAVVKECLIGDYTRVSPVATIENKMVYAGKCIQPDGHYLDIDKTDIGWIIDDVRKKISLNETQKSLFDIALKVSSEAA